jgi:hypothetical protein
MVEGTIVDKDTGKPVPFASVGIVGTSKGTSSNQEGQFSISITQPFSLKITCIGYETLVVSSVSEITHIELKPIVTELTAIVILDKTVNAKRVMRKAFANIHKNYSTQPFLQKFFYRHYCKDDKAYGRLIEAAVDVWKNNGYKLVQPMAGQNEAIRISQLRRSLDKTEMAQGHEPISVADILQADLIGYQTDAKSDYLNFYTDVSNLRTDFDNYTFSCSGVTYYDGMEVYEIDYVHKKDSVITTAGNYLLRPRAHGTLYITTDTFAFIKTEDVRTYGENTTRTTAYYRKYDNRYYPYHFIREGESQTTENKGHSFHIELMSVEVKKGSSEKFFGKIPGREELLQIPYDSVYWTTSTILKTTPLEDAIISDLGGGKSLSKQFNHYYQYEMNLHDGGVNGEGKFNWLKEDSKGNRILYLIFWSTNFKSYLVDMELAKRLHKQYRNKITFVLLALDDDEVKWKQTLEKFNLQTDGIINYRIGSRSKLIDTYRVKEIPHFVLLTRSGEVFDLNAKRPSNPLLENDFKELLNAN